MATACTALPPPADCERDDDDDGAGGARARALSAALGFPIAEFETTAGACAWMHDWIWHCCAGLDGVDDEAHYDPVAVFDVDMTLLDRNGHVMSLVHALYDACRACGVTRCMVTARPERGRAETRRQMREAGIDEPAKLFMHPDHRPCSNTHEAGAQKHKARRRIGAHAWHVRVNIGDAWHDHLHPVPSMLSDTLRRDRVYAFVTADGVAHLKLAG